VATINQTPNPETLYSLEDDMVKLVAYTIVTLKRDHEEVMDGGQDSVIVTDNMTGEAFSSWIVAKYLQEEVEVSSAADPKKTEKRQRSSQIDEEDLKYLRVYYVVSYRWPRQPAKFEERETEVLRRIGERMK